MRGFELGGASDGALVMPTVDELESSWEVRLLAMEEVMVLNGCAGTRMRRVLLRSLDLKGLRACVCAGSGGEGSRRSGVGGKR